MPAEHFRDPCQSQGLQGALFPAKCKRRGYRLSNFIAIQHFTGNTFGGKTLRRQLGDCRLSCRR
jgi:hypothetical protein